MWVLSLGAAEFFPAFGLPVWSVRAFVLAGVAAIPIVALLSWKFDLGRDGLIRDVDSPLSDESAEAHLLRNLRRTTITRPEHGFISVSWLGPNGTPVRREFTHGFVVGRDLGADVRLDDSRVSRRHLEVDFQNGSWRLRDLHSSNGTYLSGAPVVEIALPPRCSLRLDRHGPELTIELHESGDATLARPR